MRISCLRMHLKRRQALGFFCDLLDKLEESGKSLLFASTAYGFPTTESLCSNTGEPIRLVTKGDYELEPLQSRQPFGVDKYECYESFICCSQRMIQELDKTAPCHRPRKYVLKDEASGVTRSKYSSYDVRPAFSTTARTIL